MSLHPVSSFIGQLDSRVLKEDLEVAATELWRREKDNVSSIEQRNQPFTPVRGFLENGDRIEITITVTKALNLSSR